MKARALLALLALGCTRNDYSVYAAPELIVPTADAVAAWNAKLDCVELHMSDDPYDVIVVPAYADGHAGTHLDGRIKVDIARVPDYQRPAVIAHELGHAMGAEHSPDARDLMFHSIIGERSPEPTAADVSQVCP